MKLKPKHLLHVFVSSIFFLASVPAFGATPEPKNAIVPPVLKESSMVAFNENKTEQIQLDTIAPFTYVNVASFQLKQGDVLEISNIQVPYDSYIAFGVTDNKMTNHGNIDDFSSNIKIRTSEPQKFIAMESGDYQIWIGNKDTTPNKNITCKIAVIPNNQLQNAAQVLDFTNKIPTELKNNADQIQFYSFITNEIDTYIASGLPIVYDKTTLVHAKLAPLDAISNYFENDGYINYFEFLKYNSSMDILGLSSTIDALNDFNKTGTYSMLFGAFGKNNNNVDTIRSFNVTINKSVSTDQFIPKNLNDMMKIRFRIQNAFIKGSDGMGNVVLSKERAEAELKKEFHITDLKGITIQTTDKSGTPYNK